MFRFLFRLILLAIVLLVLGFIFAPNLVSTKWGKNAIFKIYKEITGNTLTADKMELSWSKGQNFENLTLVYPKKNATFIAPHITTDATLWQLLFSHNIGNMEMKAPQLLIHSDLKTAQLDQFLKKKQLQASAGLFPRITIGYAPMKSLPPYLGHLTITDGNVKFSSSNLDPIELENIALDVSLLKSQVKLKGNGKTSQESVKGDFDFSLSYQPTQSQIDLTANLQNFPVRSLDQTVAIVEPKLKGALLESIGQAINVQLKLRNLPQTLELFCDATSPSFSAHIETAAEDGKAMLAKPALVQFNIPQGVIQKFSAIPLQNSFQGQLKIEELSFPLSDRESFSFQATLKSEALQFPFAAVQPFAVFLSTENFKNRNFTLKIDSPQIHLNSSLYLPPEWAYMTWKGEGLFANNTHVDFSAQTLSKIVATIRGDEWQGNFSGGFDSAQNTVFMDQPTEIVYQITQLPAPLPPLLDQPSKLRIQVKPFSISLTNFSGPISLEIQADPTVIKGLPLGPTLLTASGEIKNKKGTFDLSSTVNKGSIQVSGSLGWPKNIVAKATLVQFPSSLIDFFLNSNTIAPIVGPEINATASLTYLPKKQQLSFDLKSETSSIVASLEKNESAILLTKPANLSLTLSPEGYESLDRLLNKTPTPFHFNQAVVIQSSIESLSVPYRQDKLMLSEFSGNGDVAIENLSFSSKNSEKNIQLNKVQLQLNRASQSSPFSFMLTASSAPEGSIALKGTLDLGNGTMDLDSRLDQFPTDALDVISRALGKSTLSIATLFGPYINLTAYSSLNHWNGPVKFQINSPNIRTSLNGALSNGLLHLNESLHIQMSMTPDLSRILLDSVNPLSLSSITADAPITLEIPASGFSYPIAPQADAKINIPSGRFELGKLYCHNEGNLNIALGLLKLSQFSQNQNLELWFAPLDFHITNSVLECERTEILIAGKYQICVWGKLNFASKKVNMVLGLTADCLKNAFGITNLPDDYVLQIPLKGTMNKVKINTAKATAKIGALLLWQQKSSSDQGAAGSLLDKFINKLGPLPGGESKAPPAKKPFPWDNGDPSKKKTAAAPKHKKLIIPDEQPLKQILKVLR